MNEFIDAATDGHLPQVQILLPGVGEEEHRVEALREAIENGHLDVAEFLLAAGVPPEHKICADRLDGYPLHAAAGTDNPRAVALLLEAGAQPDVVNRNGYSPLSLTQSVPVARLLLDAGADVNAGRVPPLCWAANHGREAVLRELLAHPGVCIDIKGGYLRQTPLHEAAKSGSPGCVASLLAAGADPCAVDDGGRNPLEIAYYAWRGIPSGVDLGPSYRTITLLVGAGARQWAFVPTPCPGLEAALVAVWKKESEERATQELAQLFRRLEPAVQAALQAALRALHHDARPFGGLPEPLRMSVLDLVLKC